MNKVVKMALVSAFIALPAMSFADTLPAVAGGDTGATETSNVSVLPTVGGGDNGATTDTTSALPPIGGGDNGATTDTDTTGLPPIGGGDNGATSAPTDTAPVISGGAGATVSSGGGGSAGFSTGTTSTTTTTTSNIVTTPITLNCPFLSGYVIPGKSNLLTDVAKVQLFMNTYTGTHLTVNGILGSDTIDAIKAFQTAHLTQVMGPWGANIASGQVYITTLKMINDIACGNTSSLTPAELAIINAYKAGQANDATVTATAGASTDATATTPVIPTSSTTPSILNTNASLVGNAFSAVGGFFKSVFHKIGSWF